ncbi:SRPBCC family protein [uncultured Polaribacter sp.]|uniref:SRPBCC family protein n=1 Tax=uncultured Polaribacter sp. TaxID=174711 RepID=UPI00261FDE36|nr:SRPBCC family protein [uncultured Polaribacter sp.]
MKTIKIILIIISLCIVTFLATGLIVKETNYTASITIDKSIEKVFHNFMKIDSTKNWIPEIQTIETVVKNPSITGSTYNIVILNNEQTFKMTQKIMAYIPNEKATFFYDAENMLKKDDFVFTQENNKTTITLNANCQSDSYIMACIFPYFKGTFKEQSELHLSNFKTYIEGL